jgi:adenine-specific DNA-methyltransferase
MAQKQKLELTWIGKEKQTHPEPRIALEEPNRSYYAKHRRECDLFDNRLIFGDNLLALKALEQEFSGKVKCIYVDPPYNTGAAFEQYDDGIEHSLWLSLIRDRFELLARLLRPDGSLWVSIDDNEAGYLRVLLDEIFGRRNFVATIIWEKRTSRENRRVFSFNHDYILVFARDRNLFEETRNLLPMNDEVRSRYKNPDNDPRGPWQSVSANAMAGHGTPSQFYKLPTPSGGLLDPPAGRCWLYTKPRMEEEIAKGNIWFGKDGTNVPRIKRFLKDTEDKGLTPETIWLADEVGTNDSAKKDLISLFDGEVVFDTPKPEGLIRQILEIATNPGDWVLDSFAGSGTTGAVAHKMGRRWIMVELGTHCHTAVLPRMVRVVDGRDLTGITAAVGWSGGGGFRYYRLAASLLERDRFGNYVISKQYNAAMLAEAMCKQMAFTYSPSDTVYWQHGHSTEQDFIYVTTQTLSREQLQKLSDEVGPLRSLLVCCAAFRTKSDAFPNLNLTKIPRAVLDRCEWGKDDYSLNVASLPQMAPDGPATISSSNGSRAARRARNQMALFGAEPGGAEE